MSKVRLLTLSVIALALLNLALIFFASLRPRLHEGPKKIIIERLKFDAGQVTRYEGLIGAHRNAVDEKEREMAEAKRQLYRLLKGDSLQERDSLIGRIGRLQEDMEAIHFQHFQGLKALCRTDQLPLFEALTDDLAAYFAPPGRPGGSKPPRK